MTLTAGCAGAGRADAGRADAGRADAGRADVRAPADRCWRKLVTHAALTVRRANAPKIIAENTLRRRPTIAAPASTRAEPNSSWRAKARHPRLALVRAAKSWMPTFVGMTGERVRVRPIDSFIIGHRLRTAERRGGHVPPRAGRRHAASAALGGPQQLLRDAIWRIAVQARATAMTWHPFRVPLPCQIAERRAEPLTATLACRSKAIPACSSSWHRQLSCTESSMPGPVRSGSRARSARTATRATSHAQIRRDNVNETRRQ